MKTLRIHPSLFVAAAMILGCQIAAADETTNSIKFSDPSKPGTLKVSIGRGDLRVQGSDSTDVVVKSEAKPITSKRRDGLREISTATGFSLTEKDNIITLNAVSHDGGRGSGDFRISVPRNTNVVVQNSWGGDVTCSSISGDVELNNMHGEIRLDDLSGSVIAGTMNGQIRASIKELHEGKPLSFTSMNGEIVLRLPETAKANVRLRTQNGSVLTDFDESILVTKTEASPVTPRGKAVSIKSNKVITVEIQDAIREATQISATAVKEALEAVKAGLEAARIDTEDARRQVEEAKRDLERARREVERERASEDRRDAQRNADRRANANASASANASANANVPTPPNAPTPVSVAVATPNIWVKPMPTITGGKLVTGTLNGGGPEISASTMNGDVVIRKNEGKR